MIFFRVFFSQRRERKKKNSPFFFSSFFFPCPRKQQHHQRQHNNRRRPRHGPDGQQAGQDPRRPSRHHRLCPRHRLGRRHPHRSRHQPDRRRRRGRPVRRAQSDARWRHQPCGDLPPEPGRKGLPRVLARRRLFCRGPGRRRRATCPFPPPPFSWPSSRSSCHRKSRYATRRFPGASPDNRWRRTASARNSRRP